MYRETCSPQRIDKSTATSLRRSGQIYKKAPKTTFFCSQCWFRLPSSTLVLSYCYSKRSLWYLPHQPTIDATQYTMLNPLDNRLIYCMLEIKGTEKGHYWNKNSGRACRHSLKEGNIMKRANILKIYLDFTLAFSIHR